KGATWGTMVYLGVSFLLGNVLVSTLSLKDPNAAGNQWRAVEHLSRLSPSESPFYMGVLLLSLASSTGLGLVGMIGLLHRRPSTPLLVSPDGEAAPTVEPVQLGPTNS